MEGVAGVSTGVDVCMLGLPQADQAFVGEQDAEMVLGVIRAQDSTQELWRKHGAGAQGDCHGLVAVEHGTTGVHVVVKGVASNVDMLVGGDQDGGVVSTARPCWPKHTGNWTPGCWCHTVWVGGLVGGLGEQRAEGRTDNLAQHPLLMQKTKGEERVEVAGTG